MDIKINEPKIVTHLENNVDNNNLSPALIDIVI